MTSGEKISKGISLFADGLGELMRDMAETFQKAVADVLPIINPFFEQKYTKKKFKKILQSYGKQRNDINKIMAQVQAPYTQKKLMHYITNKEVRKRRVNR